MILAHEKKKYFRVIFSQDTIVECREITRKAQFSIDSFYLVLIRATTGNIECW